MLRAADLALDNWNSREHPGQTQGVPAWNLLHGIVVPQAGHLTTGRHTISFPGPFIIQLLPHYYGQNCDTTNPIFPPVVVGTEKKDPGFQLSRNSDVFSMNSGL